MVERCRVCKGAIKIDEFTEEGAQQEAIVANLSQRFRHMGSGKVPLSPPNLFACSSLVASIDDKPVAYVCYELDRSCFIAGLRHSFGVSRVGNRNDLMERQHEWCRTHGYKKVRTKTKYRSKAMLILNIKTGFEIVGYDATMENNPKIIFEKTL